MMAFAVSPTSKQKKNHKGFKIAIYTLLCSPTPCRNNLRWVILKRINTMAAWSGKIVRHSEASSTLTDEDQEPETSSILHISWSLHMKWILDVLCHMLCHMFFVKKYVTISFPYDKNHGCFEGFKPSCLCVCLHTHTHKHTYTRKELHISNYTQHSDYWRIMTPVQTTILWSTKG